eukprot:CAMPEP_0116552140 /NCGR_PEP_ID=MMETSP0397-20121206/6327_1 /TAXON_ID=216820 /ORGANISM="Cyclophora tenuis, Strain ECT3854" /LENGTH=511 /DNA_ID=CAMNT_0004077069 /DNA_START=32 /DNA_END=1567 /DNA_ORIENTATION=-
MRITDFDLVSRPPTDSTIKNTEEDGPPLSQMTQESTATPPVDVGKKRMTINTMSSNLKKMQYAVRGEVVIVFDHIIYTNIGNPQSVGQKPLTWPRQVLALVDLPEEVGVNHPQATKMFPADAIRRAKEIKSKMGGGTGAYSHSKGVRLFREDVAAFIEERDGGVPSEPEDIFLTNGASAGIGMIMQAIVSDENCGVMIPIPQYPIYSATIDLLGGKKVGYYLDEKSNWDLNLKELERSITEARAEGINVNSFVLINPGNPTGQVLSKTAVKDIVQFCAKHKLVLLADEVYQENIYDDDMEFMSCKRAAYETGLLERDEIELVSFHSTSKGLFGECGRRGGYMELVGFDAEVKDQIYKLASSFLCSTLSGQVMTSLMVRGPKPGDESYESHEAEMKSVYESLKRRSKIVSEGLNAIPGFSCQPAQGAMYCFPSVEMPPGALTAAKEKGTTPDTLFAVSLLEKTGICVVPASGFGQEKGRFGFRTTFLPSEEELKRVVGDVKSHYESFCQEYA